MGTQLDDALLEQQRAVYAVEGVDESEPAQPLKQKRKHVYTNGENVRRIRLTGKSKAALMPHIVGGRRSSGQHEES